MRTNVIISVGSFNAALAIILSAFAAHGLQRHLDASDLETFMTACDFHFWHAVGIMLVGLIAQQDNNRNYKFLAWLMLLGIFLFCGSLYLLSIFGLRWLGWVTPFGGLAFIFTWGLLGWKTLRTK